MSRLSNNSNNNKIYKLKERIDSADAVIIGAGSGLSTAAGFIYSGLRFGQYFADFAAKYHFRDMYSGGFYPFGTLEEYWAYWSRYIYINRYMDTPFDVYNKLLSLVADKDYFVITTNVDHCFQKAGFDKKRLYYTQGDYGLLQCSRPCHEYTYDNEKLVTKMLISQGINPEHFSLDGSVKMNISTDLIPHCPKCGRPMSVNLRADSTFVQDEGWYKASERYELFIRRHRNVNTLLLELGVGYNTPGIIKYPFWQMTARNDNITYACINMNETYLPDEIKSKSICIEDDIRKVINDVEAL